MEAQLDKVLGAVSWSEADSQRLHSFLSYREEELGKVEDEQLDDEAFDLSDLAE